MRRPRARRLKSLLRLHEVRLRGLHYNSTAAPVGAGRLCAFVAANLFAGVFAACAPAQTPTPSPAAPATPAPIVAAIGGELPPEAQQWVERMLASLTLRQKVAQMVSPWVAGEYMPLESDHYDRLRQWVVEEGVGGVIISIGAPLEVTMKLNQLQELARVPLLVSADMEYSPGMRLHAGYALPSGLNLGGGTQFPPLMAFGAAGDERLAYEMGRITALEGRAAGVHMTYAPVADVNNNPANPIINTRSYGADPAMVGRIAAAHIRRLQEHGMLATAKHFPGHGDTDVDSHIDLPVIGVDRARAAQVELPPFRAAVEAGVAAVMSAHIAFPALTGDTVPATLHPQLLTGLLQEELGFDGLVVTDALDMGGIVRQYGQAEAAVLAVLAGADQLLMPPDVRVAIDGVMAAIERGEITEARIDHSVRKLLQTKAALGLHQQRTVALERVPQVVGIRAHQQVAQRVAERSLTLVRDRDDLIPLPAGEGRRVLSIIYTDDPDPTAGRSFQRALAAQFPAMETAFLDARTPPVQLDSLLAAAAQADVVLFSPFVRVLAWKGDVAIAEPVAAFVRRLAGQRPTVVTAFGNPYVLSQFPQVGTYLLAWGQQDVAQLAAARALTGQIPMSGRLPIAIPPHHGLGEGVERAARVAGANP